MAATVALDQLIVSTPGVCGGRPRIAGRRITVEDIAIWHDALGLSADQIASEYDLTLTEIYAALAYYFANREEIDHSISDGQKFVEEMRNAGVSRSE